MKLSVRLTAAFTVLGLIVVTTVAALSWLTSAAEIREVADDELKQSRDVVELFLESELGRRLLEDPDPSNRPPETGADSGAIAVFGNGATGPNAVFTVPSETIDHVLLGEEVFAAGAVVHDECGIDRVDGSGAASERA